MRSWVVDAPRPVDERPLVRADLHQGLRVHTLTRGAASQQLNYSAELFDERQLRSVTANTRTDGEQFLRLAARFGIRATTHPYPMDQADHALRDLAHAAFNGAAVLVN